MHPEPFDDGRRILLPIYRVGEFHLVSAGEMAPEDIELLKHRLRTVDRELARIVANRFTPEGFSIEAVPFSFSTVP